MLRTPRDSLTAPASAVLRSASSLLAGIQHRRKVTAEARPQEFRAAAVPHIG